MANIDAEITLYEVNKQLMDKKDPLTDTLLARDIADIASWTSFVQDKYFMLLCHELRDYTLFHFVGSNKKIHEASQELLETLQTRGEVISIDYEANYYSIWLRMDGKSVLYLFFPYDEGVVEI